MKTSIKGVEMEAAATVRLSFTVGGRTVTTEVRLDVAELLADPEAMGEQLRSCWFEARSSAVKAHRELGNVSSAGQQT